MVWIFDSCLFTNPQVVIDASKYDKAFYQLLNTHKYNGKLVTSTEEF